MNEEVNLKKEYIHLISSGYATEIVPFLTGDWTNDKELFLSYFYDNNINYVKYL